MFLRLVNTFPEDFGHLGTNLLGGGVTNVRLKLVALLSSIVHLIWSGV